MEKGKPINTRALRDGEAIRVLKQSAFAIESVAHLRGLEYLLLPVTERLRSVIAQLETVERRHAAIRGVNHG